MHTNTHFWKYIAHVFLEWEVFLTKVVEKINTHIFCSVTFFESRSRWPRGLRRRSTAARLLRSWVRIPPVTWMFVCCECCVLSGRGLCDEPITRPEESYWLWCVVVCDLETSWMMRPWPALGRSATREKKYFFSKIVPFVIMWKNIIDRVRPQWEYGSCALHAGCLSLQNPHTQVV